MANSVDYSLYLVTDSTPAILGDKDLVKVVQDAIAGGVTIVQYRDKTSDTGVLIKTAHAIHQVTKAAGIPFLINDRVDVALAVGVEGVHIGQDDIDISAARDLLGPKAIIGVTANSEDEALAAAKAGANYLGLGTVFATPTKDNAKSIIGTAGVRQILGSLASGGYQGVRTVCIGGINAANVQRVLYQTAAPQKQLDGVAVVSAIVAAADARQASEQLLRLVRSPPPFATNVRADTTIEEIVAKAPAIIKAMASKKPLCHNMTNLVVQNFAANVALAIGSSPIMSNDGSEAADLAALGGSLVINMGTTTPEMRANHIKALSAYNAVGGPVLFDPVGAGATQQRRDGVKALMAAGYFDVIKGNEGEIRTVSGAAGVKQHGVDSGASQLSQQERIQLVRTTAERERNIILMTGSTDVISDGQCTFLIHNGHPLLGEITGSGCTLGTTIASMIAVERENKLLAALAGILLYEIAAEQAAPKANGPGTFIPAFIDELYNIREACKKGDASWLSSAIKVEAV
ncbi:hypothetical protein AMS68_006628 [Peltaster fructicola]|uniref:Thiamine phosphate synthase/TenI domain-containing protein n=1 Tax=Peltaster fructicola TaxID=286661 RepID=A0A6H0Y2G9_9PEZI|nr:hypothetical protein AMS68_006628 [Peltaster fructicola]